jgi:hypothetical protein
MTNGPVNYTTPALTSVGGSDEYTFQTTNLPPSLLRSGTNLLAVEIHQANGTSSDVSFDLYLFGQSDRGRPQLAVSRTSATELDFAWPADASGFQLEAASDLIAGDWQPATGTPVMSNGRVQLGLPPNPGNRFYRLSFR